VLDTDLHQKLVLRFTETLMCQANLPAARRSDVEDAPRFSAAEDEITCVCGITGSTYTEEWDGTRASAEAFAERVAEETAWLVRETPPRYAWLRASR